MNPNPMNRFPFIRLFLSCMALALAGVGRAAESGALQARVPLVRIDDAGPLRPYRIAVSSTAGRTTVSGWVRTAARTLPEWHRLEVDFFDADRRLLGRGTTRVRLTRNRHGTPFPDRFVVVGGPWPETAAEVVIRSAAGAPGR